MRGKVPEHAVSVELEVPFHDVDPLFVVWHGHYWKYAAAARRQLMIACNLDVPQLAEMGFAMMVIDTRCRFSYPLHYGDRFRVTAWLKDVSNRVNIVYEIWNLTHDRRAARAYTVLVTTTRDGEMLYETPEEIRERLPI